MRSEPRLVQPSRDLMGWHVNSRHGILSKQTLNATFGETLYLRGSIGRFTLIVLGGLTF